MEMYLLLTDNLYFKAPILPANYGVLGLFDTQEAAQEAADSITRIGKNLVRGPWEPMPDGRGVMRGYSVVSEVRFIVMPIKINALEPAVLAEWFGAGG